MNSTNDEKEVKSDDTSGLKGKTYYIEIYKALETRLRGDCDLNERTQQLCEAWRLVHSLLERSAASTHFHLLNWLECHTSRTILLTEWQSPKSKGDHASLTKAITHSVEESKVAITERDGGGSPWELYIVERGEWYRRTLDNPWGHPVLRVLLDPRCDQPSNDQILEWLKEERGLTFVLRLRQLAASKCDDLAAALVGAVMDRVRADLVPVPDHEQLDKDDPPDNPLEPNEVPTFTRALKYKAGFTQELWELVADLEFVLLHKCDKVSKCIELAKQTPLRKGYLQVERLQNRRTDQPREKKLWKNAKDVAILIAQVVIARCMVVPVCAHAALTALYRCARGLARMVPAGRLPAAAATLAAPAATARHLHTLAAAVHAQCNEDMRPFICELYVRAITAGMNELERLKLKTEKASEARAAEQTLSSWFTQLGGLLAASDRVKFECALTAFSVHPSPAMYDRIRAAPALPALKTEEIGVKDEVTSEFGSWATDSRTQTNLVKTSETLNIKQTQQQANVLSTAILTEGEALGLTPELCQDLAVLLSGPRVKTLSWNMNRDLLLENCRTYMERTHGGTRALTTELKYLNLDPSSYEHLPMEEEEDENDLYYGIEKGYEHLVEFQDQDEGLWQSTLFDSEETKSADSCGETDFELFRRKKKSKKQKKAVIVKEEEDPLSIVPEIKSEKKERPYSKERINKDKNQLKEKKEKKKKTKSSEGLTANRDVSLERQKDSEQKKENGLESLKEKKEKKKKTKSSEGLTGNRDVSLERQKDSEQKKENGLENLKEKKKEKKPRKKKLKEVKGEFLVPPKSGSLSNLIGLKVAKMNTPQISCMKNTEMRQTPCIVDSDDSLGQPILASFNLHGSDPAVVFDGLFTMDDYKSPEKQDPLSNQKCPSKNEFSINQNQIAINMTQTQKPTLLHTTPTLVAEKKIVTLSSVSDQVKKSITKLAEYRRQKSLSNIAQKVKVPISSQKKVIKHQKPNAIVQPVFPEQTIISPKAVNVPEIPKVYINKNQVDLDLKTELGNSVKSIVSQQSVIHKESSFIGINKHIAHGDYRTLPSSNTEALRRTQSPRPTNNPELAQCPTLSSNSEALRCTQSPMLSYEPEVLRRTQCPMPSSNTQVLRHTQSPMPSKHHEVLRSTQCPMLSSNHEASRRTHSPMPCNNPEVLGHTQCPMPSSNPEALKRTQSPSQINPHLPQDLQQTPRQSNESPTQQNFEDFIRELTKSINAGTLQTKSIKSNPGSKTVKKDVDLKSFSADASPVRYVKNEQRKKVEMQLDTFARRSYMHKNRQMGNVKSRNAAPGRMIEEPKATILKYDTKQNVLSSLLSQNSANASPVVRNEIKPPDKTLHSVQNAQNFTTPKPPIQQRINNGNKIVDPLHPQDNTKIVTPRTYSRESSLSDKDQLDILQILRQKNNLNNQSPVNVFNNDQLNVNKFIDNSPYTKNKVSKEFNARSTMNTCTKVDTNSNHKYESSQLMTSGLPSQTTVKAANLKSSKLSKTPTVLNLVSKNINISQNEQLTPSMAESNLKMNTVKVSSKKKDSSQEWTKVMDALLAQKTPTRGINAMDALMKGNYSDLCNQPRTRPTIIKYSNKEHKTLKNNNKTTKNISDGFITKILPQSQPTESTSIPDIGNGLYGIKVQRINNTDKIVENHTKISNVDCQAYTETKFEIEEYSLKKTPHNLQVFDTKAQFITQQAQSKVKKLQSYVPNVERAAYTKKTVTLPSNQVLLQNQIELLKKQACSETITNISHNTEQSLFSKKVMMDAQLDIQDLKQFTRTQSVDKTVKNVLNYVEGSPVNVQMTDISNNQISYKTYGQMPNKEFDGKPSQVMCQTLPMNPKNPASRKVANKNTMHSNSQNLEASASSKRLSLNKQVLYLEHVSTPQSITKPIHINEQSCVPKLIYDGYNHLRQKSVLEQPYACASKVERHIIPSKKQTDVTNKQILYPQQTHQFNNQLEDKNKLIFLQQDYIKRKKCNQTSNSTKPQNLICAAEELTQQRELFVSGLDNSDYDILEELIDDELRQEIGELSSDDGETADVTTNAKGSKIRNLYEGNNVINKNSTVKSNVLPENNPQRKSHSIMQPLLNKLNTNKINYNYDSKSDILSRTATNISDNLTKLSNFGTVTSQNQTGNTNILTNECVQHQTPLASNYSTNNIADKKQLTKNCQANVEIPVITTMTCQNQAMNLLSNRTAQQEPSILTASSVSVVDAGDIIITSLPEPAVGNVLLIRPELVYDPYAEVCNVTQTPYIGVNNTPNVTVYQRTQIAAPVVNQIIIGATANVPLPADYSTFSATVCDTSSRIMNKDLNNSAVHHFSSETTPSNKVISEKCTTLIKKSLEIDQTKQMSKHKETICDMNVDNIISDETKNATVLNVTLDSDQKKHISKPKETTLCNDIKKNIPNKTKSIDDVVSNIKAKSVLKQKETITLMDMNRNCDRKVLSEVQEKLIFDKCKHETQKDLIETNDNQNKNKSEPNKFAVMKNEKDQSRVEIKRLAIINRQINHRSDMPPIVLSYLPLIQNNPDNFVAQNERNIVDHTISDENTVINDDGKLSENSKENSEDIKSRGIFLRSSKQSILNEASIFERRKNNNVSKRAMQKREKFIGEGRPSKINKRIKKPRPAKAHKNKNTKSTGLLMPKRKPKKKNKKVDYSGDVDFNKTLMDFEEKLSASRIPKYEMVKCTQAIQNNRLFESPDANSNDAHERASDVSVTQNIVNTLTQDKQQHQLVPEKKSNVSKNQQMNVVNKNPTELLFNNDVNSTLKSIDINSNDALHANNVDVEDMVKENPSSNFGEMKDNVEDNALCADIETGSNDINEKVAVKHKSSDRNKNKCDATTNELKNMSTSELDDNKTQTQESKTIQKENNPIDLDHKPVQDNISIESISIPKDDPNKRYVRIKLPNGKIFKATVCGNTNVSIESLFASEFLKTTLLENVQSTTRYTVNIKHAIKPTENADKIMDMKIVDSISVKPSKVTKLIECVSLLSDDEDDSHTRSLKTEFGTFNITSLDSEDLTKHQKKLSQTCVVMLTNYNLHIKSQQAVAEPVDESLSQTLETCVNPNLDKCNKSEAYHLSISSKSNMLQTDMPIPSHSKIMRKLEGHLEPVAKKECTCSLKTNDDVFPSSEISAKTAGLLSTTNHLCDDGDSTLNSTMQNSKTIISTGNCINETYKKDAVLNIIKDDSIFCENKHINQNLNLNISNISNSKDSYSKVNTMFNSEVIQIDDSSNDSIDLLQNCALTPNQLILNTNEIVTDKINGQEGDKIIELKSLLLRDLGVLDFVNNDKKTTNVEHNEYNCIDTIELDDCDENLVQQKITKGCFVELIRCDELVKKYENEKIMNQKCYVDLVRCDAEQNTTANEIAYINKEDCFSSNNSNNMGIEDDKVSYSDLSRSGSLSLLTDFAFYVDEITPIMALSNYSDNDRSSPVIEVFETIAALNNYPRTNNENIHGCSKNMVQDYYQCCCDWNKTKYEFYSESKVINSHIKSVPIYRSYYCNNTELTLKSVPSLKSLTANIFQDYSVLDYYTLIGHLTPEHLLRIKDIPISRCTNLKRKLNIGDNTCELCQKKKICKYFEYNNTMNYNTESEQKLDKQYLPTKTANCIYNFIAASRNIESNPKKFDKSKEQHSTDFIKENENASSEDRHFMDVTNNPSVHKCFETVLPSVIEKDDLSLNKSLQTSELLLKKEQIPELITQDKLINEIFNIGQQNEKTETGVEITKKNSDVVCPSTCNELTQILDTIDEYENNNQNVNPNHSCNTLNESVIPEPYISQINLKSGTGAASDAHITATISYCDEPKPCEIKTTINCNTTSLLTDRKVEIDKTESIEIKSTESFDKECDSTMSILLKTERTKDHLTREKSLQTSELLLKKEQLSDINTQDKLISEIVNIGKLNEESETGLDITKEHNDIVLPSTRSEMPQKTDDMDKYENNENVNLNHSCDRLDDSMNPQTQINKINLKSGRGAASNAHATATLSYCEEPKTCEIKDITNTTNTNNLCTDRKIEIDEIQSIETRSIECFDKECESSISIFSKTERTKDDHNLNSPLRTSELLLKKEQLSDINTQDKLLREIVNTDEVNEKSETGVDTPKEYNDIFLPSTRSERAQRYDDMDKYENSNQNVNLNQSCDSLDDRINLQTQINEVNLKSGTDAASNAHITATISYCDEPKPCEIKTITNITKTTSLCSDRKIEIEETESIEIKDTESSDKECDSSISIFSKIARTKDDLTLNEPLQTSELLLKKEQISYINTQDKLTEIVNISKLNEKSKTGEDTTKEYNDIFLASTRSEIAQIFDSIDEYENNNQNIKPNHSCDTLDNSRNSQVHINQIDLKSGKSAASNAHINATISYCDEPKLCEIKTTINCNTTKTSSLCTDRKIEIDKTESIEIKSTESSGKECDATISILLKTERTKYDLTRKESLQTSDLLLKKEQLPDINTQDKLISEIVSICKRNEKSETGLDITKEHNDIVLPSTHSEMLQKSADMDKYENNNQHVNLNPSCDMLHDSMNPQTQINKINLKSGRGAASNANLTATLSYCEEPKTCEIKEITNTTKTKNLCTDRKIEIDETESIETHNIESSDKECDSSVFILSKNDCCHLEKLKKYDSGSFEIIESIAIPNISERTDEIIYCDDFIEIEVSSNGKSVEAPIDLMTQLEFSDRINEELVNNYSYDDDGTFQTNPIIKEHVIETVCSELLDHAYAIGINVSNDENECNINKCDEIYTETASVESTEVSEGNFDKPFQKQVTLVYKDGSDLVLKGIEYEDPVVGTCYVFPLTEKIHLPHDNRCLDDQSLGQDSDIDDALKVEVPKLTYSKSENLQFKGLSRKRKLRDTYKYSKRYRKAKNIDCPKHTASANSTYCKEYKRVFDYCDSLKISLTQPYHKDVIDTENIVRNWPIKGSLSDSPQNTDKQNYILFHDDEEIQCPANSSSSTLVEDLNDSYKEDTKPIAIQDSIEDNFNMGFGERSDRVIQNFKNTDDVTYVSAATLSDVKQIQPFLVSEDKNQSPLEDTVQDQMKNINRFVKCFRMRDKVRSFFERTTAELQYDCIKKGDKNNIFDDQYPYNNNIIYPFDHCNSDFFDPSPFESVVQVVQVGQSLVSAAAQNAVSCDPRITRNVSPSQCPIENSPQDNSEVTIKTEYTELTTADLTNSIVQEYVHQKQTLAVESQNQSNLMVSNENIPTESYIKSEIKIEIKEEKEFFESNDTESLEYQQSNSVIYSMELNQDDNHMSEKTDQRYQTNYEDPTEKQNTSETFSQTKVQNGVPEKTDQIAHAMNAAGIITTPETITNTNRTHSLVNIMSQKSTSDHLSTTPTGNNSFNNNYSKTTAINAMALQQALAQILPPPLNQSGSSDNSQQSNNPQVTPQVLHIVQGKHPPGSQITHVDNTNQSVINTPNTTPVLHIAQNKTGSPSTNSNASAAQAFSGISLVDTGLQQGGNQLLHIVNTGGQKNNHTTGQLLKRVNLLANLANVQGSNEQKMVQLVCKSADGKTIQLNAPHQRSIMFRVQTVEPTNINLQTGPPKSVENHEVTSTINTTISNTTKDCNSSQQEIKSRSVYEENYAKFIQNSKSAGSEKSTTLPKFNQAFGKPVFQEGNQKENDLSSGNVHLGSVNNTSDNSDCQSTDNSMNLDQIGEINSPPLLLRKSSAQQSTCSQAQTNIVQQFKPTTAMNIQTMHGGVIYTRQIPVIGGGQTINLITVPSTELLDDSSKQQLSSNQNEIEPSIIKIVPQNPSTTNSEATSDDRPAIRGSNETSQNLQPQPVTQMRIKLPMLSKTPQMVSGARVVRPSFFQIQRNVIAGTNQPVYQQLILTAAPPIGQQTIRMPQTQSSRQIKVSTENQSSPESQMSSSTLEQLREFDMVLEQVKERSTTQPTNTTFSKLSTPSTDTKENIVSASSTTSSESTQQVLYSSSNNQQLNVSCVNRKPVTTHATSTASASSASSEVVRSPDSSGIVESTHSTNNNKASHTKNSETSQKDPPLTPTQSKPSKSSSKSKSKSKSSNASMKLNTIPPKSSSQKPLEDEQTTQRILYILAEYKEQVENSPDKDKPAPRRRTIPPLNLSHSKRKKSSCSSRRHSCRDMSPIYGEDSCRTMGSEDSSCGTSLGDCNESCLENNSPQESPRKVARQLTFEQENPTTPPLPQPQRNVIVADGQTITVARSAAGKPATAVLMPTNYILPVSMVKGGQQIAIVTNRGPKLLTVTGGEGGAANALLLQRLIGTAGLKPVLARPGVRHVRLPTTALQNLQAFNLATATTVQAPDSTAPSVSAPTPPELVDTRATSSPWPDRSAQDTQPESSNNDGSEPWHFEPIVDPLDYSYEEIVRTENMDRTVLDPIPDRYSPDMEAQRIFDKMFDVDSKKSYMGDSHDDSPHCGYDIDASDCDDKAYHQVVHKKDGTSHRQHRFANVSSATLRHKYAILEHELRLQKSLSEECEDLGVDSPSASELFPEAELLFSSSPAHEHVQEHAHLPHTPQPTILSQGCVSQPDLEDQIATDELLARRDDDGDEQELHLDELDDVGGMITVSEDGQTTVALDHEEFARSHPNTTFHSEEPTDDMEIQPYTITGLKGPHITSTIFHASRAPATVLMAPQTTVISQATSVANSSGETVKYTDIDNMIDSIPSGPDGDGDGDGDGHDVHGHAGSALVRDDGLARYDREPHLSRTATAVVHSKANATQVIRRVCYEEDRRDPRYLLDEPESVIAGDGRRLMTERTPHDAAYLALAAERGGDRSSPERHADLFWETNSASERSDGRRPLDFSSDSDKCCRSPCDETNSTDSSGVGAHMRLDSVIKTARGSERSGGADGFSVEDALPLRTHRPGAAAESERSLSGKTRAGQRSPEGAEGAEGRRRASGRGVVKRGCHCCIGSPAPVRTKKSRQRRPVDYSMGRSEQM